MKPKEIQFLIRKKEMLGVRIERLVSDLERTTPVYGWKVGKGSKTREDTLAELADLKTQYTELQDKERIERNKLLEKIEMLPDDEQTIMPMRYILDYTWTKVSIESHYSRTQCFNIHKRAMEKIK